MPYTVYTVVNKSNTWISWADIREEYGISWFSGELPAGETREVKISDPSAAGKGISYLPQPSSNNPWRPLGANSDANVLMYGGGKHWGRVWIQKGKTLEVYGEKDWWLK